VPVGPLHQAVYDGRVPLEEFVQLPRNRNRVSGHFLRGYTLEDLDFVGITEHFGADLADLARRLRWPSLAAPHELANDLAPYRNFRPAESLVRRIRALNEDDVALYEEALRLRAARRHGSRVADG
jgi:hypothetical protein